MIPSESNSERLTRKRLIDPKLKAAGWKIVPFSPQKTVFNDGPCAIEEFETTNGPADYALCVDGQIVGIVEAKKLTLGPQGVLMQAERYCKGLKDSPFNYRGFRVPFLYSTYGGVIWHHDIRHGASRSCRDCRYSSTAFPQRMPHKCCYFSIFALEGFSLPVYKLLAKSPSLKPDYSVP